MRYHLHQEPVEGWLSCQFDPSGHTHGPTVVFMNGKPRGVRYDIDRDAMGTYVVTIQEYNLELFREIISFINGVSKNRIEIIIKTKTEAKAA